MNKGIIFGLMMISMILPAMAVSETPEETVVNGIVYSGETIDSDPVVGAEVTVTCEFGEDTWIETDTTIESGYYHVEYNYPDCPVGATVTSEACLEGNCGSASDIVMDTNEWVNIVGINIFGVPEFGTIAAGVALVGAAAGFFVLRRRK